jgi:nucleotide-binding universal stress UspA family protein
MVHKIMVPLDGSAFAEAALPTALHLARRDAAAVQLVMVEEVPLTIEHGGGAPARDPGLDQTVAAGHGTTSTHSWAGSMRATASGAAPRSWMDRSPGRWGRTREIRPPTWWS